MIRFAYSFILMMLLGMLIPADGVAQNGNGETENSVEINVGLSLNGSIQLITIQSIDFQGIERNDSILRVDPIQSVRAGKLVARGNPGSDFRLDYLTERELTNTLGTGILTFNYEVSGNDIDEQETSEMLDQEVRELQFNDDGEFFIWVGGRVDISQAEPGSYEGEFTIEIEYL